MNAFQLKLLMAALMVLDHLYKIPGLLSPTLVIVFHFLTRCVAVWFAYAAVEGFIHTRSRLRYNGCLFFWAAMMFLGNTLINTAYAAKGIVVTNNIFFTLATGVLMLNLLFYESPRRQEAGGLRLAAALLVAGAGLFLTEGGLVIIPFMLISYVGRQRLRWRNLCYVALSALLLIGAILPPLPFASISQTICYNCHWFFISVLPFLYLYNGQRGPRHWAAKYFFYLFYPLHLWLIATIAYFVTPI